MQGAHWKQLQKQKPSVLRYWKLIELSAKYVGLEIDKLLEDSSKGKSIGIGVISVFG